MTDYYLRTICDGFKLFEEFWAVNQRVAYQGIVPSELGTFRAAPGQDMLTVMQDSFQNSQFHKLELGPGEYYPRMARPSSTQEGCSPGHNPDRSKAARNIRTTSTGQLHALIQELQQICQVVHPEEANFGAYGHEIRNIIIIACTEVEAQWKNILAANGHKAENRLDYVKLAPVMRLGEYQVSMSWYPWLQPRTPFWKWEPVPQGRKQFLPWYDAYNAVKHDREQSFAHAKLEHALNSVAACFVMLCAQYGWDFAKQGDAAQDAFFQLIEAPKWSPSEIYIPPHGVTKVSPHGAAGAFKPRNYPF